MKVRSGDFPFFGTVAGLVIDPKGSGPDLVYEMREETVSADDTAEML